MSLRWAVAVSAAFVMITSVAGCSGDGGDLSDGSSPSASPSGSQVVVSSGCPGESESVTDDDLRLPGSLEGDVDGDGTSDEVYLARARAREPGCEVFLVADTAGSILSTTVDRGETGLEGAQPGLVGLADVDGRPGDEIIARMISGASTEFFALFSTGSGTLEPLDVRGGDFGGLFPSGGGAGHLEASDCDGDRGVVVATAVPQEDDYLVRRAVFTFDGVSFVHDRRLSEKRLVSADDLAAGAVPEFASGAPFGSCPTD